VRKGVQEKREEAGGVQLESWSWGEKRSTGRAWRCAEQGRLWRLGENGLQTQEQMF